MLFAEFIINKTISEWIKWSLLNLIETIWYTSEVQCLKENRQRASDIYFEKAGVTTLIIYRGKHTMFLFTKHFPKVKIFNLFTDYLVLWNIKAWWTAGIRKATFNVLSEGPSSCKEKNVSLWQEPFAGKLDLAFCRQCITVFQLQQWINREPTKWLIINKRTAGCCQ